MISEKNRKNSDNLGYEIEIKKDNRMRIPEKYIISYKSSFKIWWDNAILLAAVYASI